MGTLTVTIQNLEVVAVDLENNCILVKGNVPGAKKSLVIIKSAVKANGKVREAQELISYEEVIATEEAVNAEVETNTVAEESEAE